MFTRKTANSLAENGSHQDSPFPSRFLRRRHESSPAKRLFDILKSGLTPSKKRAGISWKQKIVKTSPDIASSRATDHESNLRPTSYAEAVTRDDSKSLTYSASPLSSKSTQSELGLIQLAGWAENCDADISSARHKYNSPVPSFSTLAKLPYSSSPAGPAVRERRAQYHRQKENYNRENDIDSDDINSDDGSYCMREDSHHQYNFCLGKCYEYALDNDLAIERKRYYENEKYAVTEDLTIKTEEEHNTKSFNRKKFNRRFGKKKSKEDASMKMMENDFENFCLLE